MSRRRYPSHRIRPLRACGRWLVTAGTALVFIAPVSATPPAPDWYRAETEHFTFYGTDPEALKEVSRDLASLRSLFVEVFPTAQHISPPAHLFLFPDEASFEPYSLGVGVGFLQLHDHASYGAVQAYSESGRRAIRRQYFHELIRQNSPSLPLWLQHGLVEVYTRSDRFDGRARIGFPNSSIDLGIWLPLDTVLQQRRLPMDQREANMFISKSWLLTHYLLIESPERRQQLVDFVFRRLDEPVSLPRHLGLSTEALSALLDDYQTLREWPIWVAPLPASAEVEPRLSQLSEAQALAQLADLLLHIDEARHPAARDHAQRALALDAQNPVAHGVLGRLDQLNGDLDSARRHLARAAELDSETFRYHYWLGMAELDAIRSGDAAATQAHQTRAVTALRRAVALRDNHAEAWARLGYALTLSSSPAADTIDVLTRARTMLPQRSSLGLHLLLAHARAGHVDAANALMLELELQGVPDGALTQAREILYQMDFTRAVALVRGGQFERAADLFEKVATGTANEALRTQAEANAAKMRQRLEPPRPH